MYLYQLYGLIAKAGPATGQPLAPLSSLQEAWPFGCTRVAESSVAVRARWPKWLKKEREIHWLV